MELAMKVGFAKSDITPRVGVELCGFGPYLNRHSIGVRDRLWARAMAVEAGGARVVVISCDLIGAIPEITDPLRARVSAATGIGADAVMVACTHTHSGPCTGRYIGWGDPDEPYMQTLPQRIAAAAIEAAARLAPATLAVAETPCEGIGLNREYERDAPPLEEVLRDDWRPARPELTDSTCRVLRFDAGDRCLGFASYFGCHPVVCCEENRYIHGDFCGVATNLVEREHSGAVGLFLQGAQGDVNTCVAHKHEQESLLALDVIAGRYARAVREGLRRAQPVAADVLRFCRHKVRFSRKEWGADKLRQLLAEKQAALRVPGATDADRALRMEAVYLVAVQRMLARLEAGEDLSPPLELHGIRIGPVALLGSPFEMFQAIKNDITARTRSPVPLVMGLVNDSVGYAPDRTAAARGGYAADTVPMICGSLPFANAHQELVEGLLAVDAALQ
jgi:hypothetical protein